MIENSHTIDPEIRLTTDEKGVITQIQACLHGDKDKDLLFTYKYHEFERKRPELGGGWETLKESDIIGRVDEVSQKKFLGLFEKKHRLMEYKFDRGHEDYSKIPSYLDKIWGYDNFNGRIFAKNFTNVIYPTGGLDPELTKLDTLVRSKVAEAISEYSKEYYRQGEPRKVLHNEIFKPSKGPIEFHYPMEQENVNDVMGRLKHKMETPINENKSQDVATSKDKVGTRFDIAKEVKAQKDFVLE